MVTIRPDGFVLATAAFLFGLLLASTSIAQNCCTHEGQSVQCPVGLPAGSGSVQFVPGGTIWVTPAGGKVTVPQTSFAGCTSAPSTPTAPSTTSPTTTPPPTTAPPAATPGKSPTPTSPTPSTTSTPTTTTQSPATQPSATPTTPTTTTPRWPVPQLVDPPRETELQAKPLNEPDQSLGAVPMKAPADDAKAIDESIQRLRVLREQQQSTQEKPPTPVTPPAPVTTAKAPDKAPVSMKAPPASSCGPDITDYVMAVLQMIMDSYKSWNADERSKRCGSLYGLGFQAAWDLQGMTPSDGEKFMPEIFFQRAAPNYCAVPRNPCGSTVVFLGFCVSAQVVNYVQWGLMNNLCDTQIKGRAALSARSFFSSDYVGQKIMSDIGADYLEIASSLDFNKKVLQRIMESLVRENQDDWYKMAGTDCPLACDQSIAAPWLENFSWGFQWGSDGEPPETKRGSELKKP